MKYNGYVPLAIKTGKWKIYHSRHDHQTSNFMFNEINLYSHTGNLGIQKWCQMLNFLKHAKNICLSFLYLFHFYMLKVGLIAITIVTVRILRSRLRFIFLPSTWLCKHILLEQLRIKPLRIQPFFKNERIQSSSMDLQ